MAEKYLNESPYIYCGNDPISYIDPDGKDRIYSASGRFIKDTHEGNLILVKIGKKLYNLSQLAYNTGGTNRAVSTIIAYEALQEGYRGKFGLYTSNRGAAHTNPTTKDVSVNTKEIKKGFYNDYNTLRNVLGHESDLVYGHKGENASGKYTYFQHAQVYLGQALDPSFSTIPV